VLGGRHAAEGEPVAQVCVEAPEAEAVLLPVLVEVVEKLVVNVAVLQLARRVQTRVGDVVYEVRLARDAGRGRLGVGALDRVDGRVRDAHDVGPDALDGTAQVEPARDGLRQVGTDYPLAVVVDGSAL